MPARIHHPVSAYGEHAGVLGAETDLAAQAILVNRTFHLTDIVVGADAISTFFVTDALNVHLFTIYLAAAGNIAITFETPLVLVGAETMRIRCLSAAGTVQYGTLIGDLIYE